MFDIVYDLIRQEIEQHPVRSIIDAVLIAFFIYMLFQKSYRIPERPEKLTEEVRKYALLFCLNNEISNEFRHHHYSPITHHHMLSLLSLSIPLGSKKRKMVITKRQSSTGD